jgi:hypothetical protein
MALGTATVGAKAASSPGIVRCDLISFAGDGAYPSGGTAAFQAYVRSALGVGNLEVLGVCAQDCGGYVPVYDKTNDKLKVYYGDNDGGADGPLVQNATSNLSAVTFNLLVFSR